MKAKKLPIINDPIYGFIRIDSPLQFELIDHPYFQRLRRISQMGLSSLVYPSARHSRFEHALGALHLMNSAILTLRNKGVSISPDEKEALGIAILLHDIGHGPFSHAMENSIFINTKHEDLSLAFMQLLNHEFDEKLSLAIAIYKNEYSRKFMHQLIASQLDIDRLDYLKRDSFFTGATEGNINSQRIIGMMNVIDDQLIIEENGLYSVEKFIMARRLMYWQVYLHKTGLAAELLLSNLMKYVRHLHHNQSDVVMPIPLSYFFENDQLDAQNSSVLHRFSLLDDTDIITAIKQWQHHPDEILSDLAKGLLYRNLLKIKIQNKPFTDKQIQKQRVKLTQMGYSQEYVKNFVFSDSISCSTYSFEKPPILIGTKSGKVKRLEEVSSLFINQQDVKQEVKYFLCYAKAK